MPGNRSSKKTSVTSKDVAALAGVSQSTVSRVLSTSDTANNFISEETSERVREAAVQLGYSPNPIARALRGQPTNLIGLVVREIADPFFAELIEVLSARVREAGLTMVLGHAHSDAGEALEMTHILDSRQCDGMVFLGDLRNDEKAIETIVNEKHPAVALCRGKSTTSMPSVNVNNDIGMRLLINHLVENGHKRFVFVHGGWYGDIHDRRDIFLKYMKEAGSDLEYSWVQASDNNASGGYDAMMRVSEMVPMPTAVMASDDALATGILKAAADLKLSIPEDLSITGFDDIECAKYTIPSLTTVMQPFDEMSRLALDLLLMQIEGKKIPEEKKYRQVRPELVIRDSSGSSKK